MADEFEKLAAGEGGEARISELTEQIKLLQELMTKSGDQYDTLLQKQTSYQQMLLDDTQVQMKALNDKKDLQKQIDDADKERKKSERSRRSATSEDEKLKFKEEAARHQQRINNLTRLQGIQNQYFSASNNQYAKLNTAAEKAEAASEKWLGSRERHVAIEEKLKRAAENAKPADQERKSILQMTTDATIGTIEASDELVKGLNKLSLETAAMSMLMPGSGIMEYYEKVMSMPGEMDTSIEPW